MEQQQAIPAPSPALVSPVSGTVVPLSDCSDKVFAQGMLGPGFVVQPEGCDIHAPVSGTIKLIHSTAHGFGISTDNSHEVLLHLGIDTVSLGSEPFTSYVHVGDHVRAGQVIANMKRGSIKAAGKSDEVVVIIDDIEPEHFSLDFTGFTKSGTQVAHLK